MILLVAKAVPSLKLWCDQSPYIGRFVQPRSCENMVGTVENGMVWAADNDAYNGFDEVRYLKMMDKIAAYPMCLFITIPDVLGDSDGTLRLFDQWKDRVKEYQLPIALVAQDGLKHSQVPWDEIDALFIGGSTHWKLGQTVVELVSAAKSKSKWVHMGRVNSNKRLHWATQIGCDSADGTGYAKFSNAMLPRAIEYLNGQKQLKFDAKYSWIDTHKKVTGKHWQ